MSSEGHSGVPAPIIPDHELIRVIGKGAFGEVWLARSNATERYRAVKVVRRDRFDEGRPYETEFAGVKKFEEVSREHEGFVDILHISRDNEARHFAYVMELADDLTSSPQIDPAGYQAKTLALQIQHQGRLTPAECIRWSLGITAALAELHRRGLVHRDIKPSNVISVRGAPKLADIGLVTEANANPGDGSRTVIGTLGFMDTEIHGSAEGDLFSFGRLLYVMATGLNPAQWPELPEGIDTSDDWETFREINAIFCKACDPVRSRRYGSAAEIHDELLMLRAGSSVARLERLERFVTVVKRYGLAALVLLGLVGFAGWQWFARNRESARLLARQAAFYGTRLAEEGNDSAGLLLFAHSFRLDEHNARSAADHRLRLSSVSRRCPTLVQMWFTPSEFNYATFAGQENQVFAPGADGRWTIYDLASGRPLYPPFGTGHAQENATISSVAQLGATVRNKDHQVVLWDIRSGRKMGSLTHTSALYRATLSRDGQWVAAATWDKTVVVWNRQTGQSLPPLTGHDGLVSRFTFNRDATRLLTASYDNTVKVWELPSARHLFTFTNHTMTVYDVAISPDGKRAASASLDRTVRVWDLETGVALLPPLRHSDTVGCVQFSPDGDRLVTAGYDLKVRIWDAQSGQLLQALQHNARPWHAEFSPGGRHIVTACLDGTVRLWDLRERWLDLPPQPIAYCPDSSRFLRGQSNTLQLVEAASGRLLGSLSLTHPLARPPVLADSGDYFLTLEQAPASPVNSELTLCRWASTAQGLAAQKVPLPRSFTNLLILSPSGRRLAAASQSEVCVLELPEGRFLLRSNVAANHLAFDRSGERLAIAAKNLLQIHNLTTGLPLCPTPWPHDTAVTSVQWSRDGAFLVTACGDPSTVRGSARVFSASGQPVGEPLQHEDGVLFAGFSLDGRRVITCSEDRTASLWEVATGRKLSGSMLHEDHVTHAAFSHDGRWVATACRDGSARIWDAATGEPLTPRLPQRHPLRFVQFVDCGRVLLTVTEAGETGLWPLPKETRSAEEWVKIGELLSAQQSLATDAMMPKSTDALRQLWNQLRARYPDEFSFR